MGEEAGVLEVERQSWREKEFVWTLPWAVPTNQVQSWRRDVFSSHVDFWKYETV